MAIWTSEAFKDTFMFVKPISSMAWTAFNADSDKASAVGYPYFSNSGRSNEPPLTPTRRGMPRSCTALITSANRHHGPMFPGLMRTQSTTSAALSANR